MNRDVHENRREGIAVAGNILADVVKRIDSYPPAGMLADILDVTRAVGGCVPNTAMDLAKIDGSLPVYAIGCVGADEYGSYVCNQMRQRGVNTDRVTVRPAAFTGFSDVMSLPSGERTFFCARGANALFSPQDVDIRSLPCRMLHIGYLLLLDCFDRPDDQFGTVMARFLHDVQQAGIRTSIDVVSGNSADYPGVIIPALPYCDYVIINEIECCAIWGIEPRNPDGTLSLSAVREAMERTMAAGVREKVIVHSTETGCCLSSSGEFTMVSSLQLPRERIKGSVGAGDAFCAGCLYGIYHGYSDTELLRFASGAAACSLFAENSVDGMLDYNEILELILRCGRDESW